MRLETAPSYRTSSFSANLGMLARRPDHLDLQRHFLSGECGFLPACLCNVSPLLTQLA